MAKNYFNRYIWLIDVINRHGHISREEISNLWVRSPLNEIGENYLPERTFHNHIDSIRETFGLEIKCDRSLGYYISNGDDFESGGVRNWLLQSLSLNNMLNESASMKDNILFEDVPSSLKFLTEIVGAMRDGKVIEITYQSFYKDFPTTFEAKPYCLKLFKQRWYMVAKTAADRKPWIYGLDRVRFIRRLDKSYAIPQKFNAQEYFEGHFGVCMEDYGGIEDIELKVVKSQASYFRSLPLHKSQEEIETTNEYSIFKYHLVPTYDLTQEILSKSYNVEVLKPQWYREEIQYTIKTMLSKYENQ